MVSYIGRFLKKVKYRIRNRFKVKIKSSSKDIYAIVLMSIYHGSHKGNIISYDAKYGDIIIKLKDLGYHVIISNNDVVISNHDFPNLGRIEGVVIDRLILKAKNEISRLMQLEKNEIIENHNQLLKKVKEKVKVRERIGRLELVAENN